MKKYKLLKDIPGVKAGTLSIDIGNGYHEFKGYDSKGLPHEYAYPEVFMDRFPDFFEEVIELEKLFTIQDMDDAYHAPTIHGSFRDYIKYSFPQHIDQLKHLK